MTDAVEIRAPAEQTEGTRSQLLRWLKNVGEHVAENEPLIEIETDKVTVEVAAPGSGILREIVKHEQEEIVPGELLGRIEPTRATSASREVAGGAPATSGVLGNTREGSAEVVPTAHAPESVRPAGSSAATRLSPAVRRLLAEHSLDPSAVLGTGQSGRITVEDVMQAVSAGTSAAGSRSLAGAPTVAAAEVSGKSHRVPHSAVRKRIAEHMVQSLLHTAPHVTTVFEADMTAVLAHRQRNRDDFARRGAPLTFTAYFLQAAVHAIRAVPETNSRWTDTALEVFDSIHIGVATALEDGGLVVPVLRDVESRELFDIAHGLNDLVTRAREGRLAPTDVRGGTFTISNHGVSGSLVATPIVINQPQSAILGIGKLEKRPVVLEEGGEDRIVVQPRCYVTLTIDHRVMDGHQANRFLQTFVHRLTSWPA
jgi:2-oxoglutarate dehydrogenase E2 component (dihydrolipoamide succinyltransferase)